MAGRATYPETTILSEQLDKIRARHLDIPFDQVLNIVEEYMGEAEHGCSAPDEMSGGVTHKQLREVLQDVFAYIDAFSCKSPQRLRLRRMRKSQGLSLRQLRPKPN